MDNTSLSEKPLVLELCITFSPLPRLWFDPLQFERLHSVFRALAVVMGQALFGGCR